ncbi:amino acid ABC transporter permease [Pseudoglutamicibacter albus]|uniref:Amino acid ABC transporter permease n=1 Tax=Pseudoglutamicibacter cumminsii TaxID=156979 RepID=A0AAP4C6T1_9MICC|nr:MULTISPECIES: amino acid ABC transporter permease [Pseudoglutamicibacter]MCT1685657.1 amino acid ABC transporter permease [Pseudoglutamicibacter cumminsii]MDK6275334.1 amino acid ABC transporter permease [Pseudoglutamicibacter cumminsii]PKY79884.1 amino acid ABC transporter permease [Pseudoglutamicibacter albus]WIK84007.1 amino acid ABC transporter permease [Pseudoglutamicibacter albus]
MAASVLYDQPGPRAKVRNRILAVITIVVVAAIVWFIISQFAAAGQFAPQKWAFLQSPRIMQGFMQGAINTLTAFGLAAVLSLALGFILAVGRLSDHAWVRAIFSFLVETFRAIPLLILMMLLYYGLPTIDIKLTPFTAVVIALTAYNGSVLAEAIRAGVVSLPKGQAEAAYAVGMRKYQVMTLILLPQAVKSMLPVIISQLVVALKDTALGFVITYQELLYQVKLIGNQISFGYPLIPAAIVGAVMYIGLCLILSGVARYAEYRINKQPGTKKARAKMESVQAS